MEMKVNYIRDDRMEFNKNSSNFPSKIQYWLLFNRKTYKKSVEYFGVNKYFSLTFMFSHENYVR